MRFQTKQNNVLPAGTDNGIRVKDDLYPLQASKQAGRQAGRRSSLTGVREKKEIPQDPAHAAGSLLGIKFS